MTDSSGAVYPGPVWTRDGHKSGYDSGMTKREYFAGQAMAAILGGYWSNSDMNGLNPHAFATTAVEHADALIAALGGKDELA